MSAHALSGFRLTTLAAALALPGCATISSTPPVKPDAGMTTIPALTASATARLQVDLAIDRWWTVFDDAALNRLIDEALTRNADLEVALARVREAQANLDATRAAHWPTLDARVQSGRENKSTASAMPLPPDVDRHINSRKAALETSYEVDLWGRLSSSTAAARNQLLGTEWARASVEWSLTAQVAETYFNLVAVDRQIEISEAVRAGRQATFDLRQREHEVGTANEFDLRRAEAELTGTDATLTNLQRQRVALDRALTLLLGRNPNEIANGKLERRMFDERQAAMSVLPQGGARDLLLRRPDVRQAEADLAAANADIAAARAAALPTLHLTGAIGSDAKSISDLFSAPAAAWSLAASVTQSIIDGGKADARVRGEHARAQQSLASYRKVIASAVLDVREAYAALDLTQQGYRAEHARVEALARARTIAKLGYDEGALNYIDLLDAERNLYQAQLDEVTAYRDQFIGQVAAFKALGGGYAGSDVQARANQ